MNNSKELKFGALLSYIRMSIGVIVGLLFTPLMLKFLGKSEYGLYNVVSSTISMLSLLNLGLNSGYIRFFSERKKNNDEKAISRLNGLYLCLFSAIAIVALGCGLFLAENLNLVFRDGLTSNEYIIAKKLMLILTVNLTISFPLSVFSSIITANERFIFIKLISLINTAANPMISFILLSIGYKSVALAVISLILQIITGIINICYVLFKLKYKFFFDKFEKSVLNNLFSYTFFIAINLIIDQINWKVDYILLGRFCGTSNIAIYSVGNTIHSLYLTLSTSISDVFTPQIHRISRQFEDIAKRSKEFSNLFIKIGRIQFLILSLIASGFVFFGKQFIYFWAGDTYINSYWVALFLMIPVTIPLIQNLGIEIQRSINKHKFRAITYSAMAILNLIISILLCPKYGEIGVAIGTSISILFGNIIIMNIYYQKACGIDIIEFWKNIFRMSIGLIIPIITFCIIKNYVKFNTPLLLAIGIISYGLIFCVSMWLISMNSYEKNLIKSTIYKLRNKI